MRILNFFLAASALIAAPVAMHSAWADCYPEDVSTLPLDEESVAQHCRELTFCASEPFDYQACVDWYSGTLSDVSDPPENGGAFTVDLNCFDSDDYLADPTVCDAVCGDDVCGGGETSTTCPEDCGVCGGGGPPPPPVSEPPPTTTDPTIPSNDWWRPSF